MTRANRQIDGTAVPPGRSDPAVLGASLERPARAGRLLVVLLCAGLQALDARSASAWIPFAVGAATLLVGATRILERRRWWPWVEAVVVSFAVSFAATPGLMLPLLLAPAVSAGLLWGTLASSVTAAIEAIVAGGVTAALPDRHSTDAVATLIEWLVITALAGGLAGWARRLLLEADSPAAAYRVAHRLLSQLREVSRRLPAGLEPRPIAEAILTDLRSVLAYDWAAIYRLTPGGSWSAIVVRGAHLDPYPADDGPAQARLLALVRKTGEVGSLSQPTRWDGGPGWAVALPLREGDDVHALLLAEGTDADALATEPLDGLLAEGSLRLETAMMFDEVKSLATVEERRRLAREIHDGIAQELAGLGYRLDDVAVGAPAGIGATLREMRGEVTRLLGDLRLSIFDLRSDAAEGLGAALADQVRQLVSATGVRVNLSLDEGPLRLPRNVEEELLRVAQEAMTNIRRHANAQNVWVSLWCRSPSATLIVEDDGVGRGAGRADSFGLSIMGERAARIDADLEVADRTGGGTWLRVKLPREREDEG